MRKSTDLLLLLTCFSVTTSIAAKVDWWEDASLYQIYPRSWKDSDGNGIGDLKGITEKLPYLKEIGITATWLSPIFKSPMVDNGYDISDFFEIDPVFGTMADFDALVKKAKQIGIKVILDFVPNHSSEECEWFQKSINREEGFEDFYVWADGKDDPQNPGQKIPPSKWEATFGGSMWTWNEKRQQYYLHQFLAEQPDFNFRNPKVRETMLGVLKFWLDRGVDGFRIDAIKHLYEKVYENGTYPDGPGSDSDPNDKSYKIYTQDQYETVEVLYEWREFLETYRKQNGGDTRVILAEAYSDIKYLDQYFGNGTHFGAHLPFNFNLMQSIDNTSNARDLETSIDDWMSVMWKKHKMANWVMSNHDGPRAVDRMGEVKKDIINILAAALPGVAVTYYGEEIGMKNLPCPNIDSVCEWSVTRTLGRSPFQWNDQTSAGFSSTTNTWLPVTDNFKDVNVQVERGYARSTLNVFKKLQALRRTAAFKAFKDEGGFSYGAVSDPVFQIIRSSPRDEYRILINMGDKTETVGPLGSSTDSISNLMTYSLVASNAPHDIGDEADLTRIVLKPFEAVVLKRMVRS